MSEMTAASTLDRDLEMHRLHQTGVRHAELARRFGLSKTSIRIRIDRMERRAQMLKKGAEQPDLIANTDIPTRCKNLLIGQGLTTWSDVRNHSWWALRRLPYSGPKSVNQICAEVLKRYPEVWANFEDAGRSYTDEIWRLAKFETENPYRKERESRMAERLEAERIAILTDMVERVARVLAERLAAFRLAMNYDHEMTRERCRYAAHAAIAAMREPTEGMLTAALQCDDVNHWGVTDLEDAATVWRAMIDAALK